MLTLNEILIIIIIVFGSILGITYLMTPKKTVEKYISYDNIPFEPENIRYYSRFNR